MKTLILLDDERELKNITWIDYPKYKEVILFKRHEEFTNFCDNVFGGDISLLNFDTIDFSFDHDLQSYDRYGKEWTGYDCIKYLLETTYLIYKESGYTGLGDINNCNFYFHTQNPIGKDNMKLYYLNFIKYLNNEKS